VLLVLVLVLLLVGRGCARGRGLRAAREERLRRRGQRWRLRARRAPRCCQHALKALVRLAPASGARAPLPVVQAAASGRRGG
jgi:hypothetical protein